MGCNQGSYENFLSGLSKHLDSDSPMFLYRGPLSGLAVVGGNLSLQQYPSNATFISKSLLSVLATRVFYTHIFSFI
jgi:hypothetical protein